MKRFFNDLGSGFVNNEGYENLLMINYPHCDWLRG